MLCVVKQTAFSDSPLLLGNIRRRSEGNVYQDRDELHQRSTRRDVGADEHATAEDPDR